VTTVVMPCQSIKPFSRIETHSKLFERRQTWSPKLFRLLPCKNAKVMYIEPIRLAAVPC
jgi:hypothetical protein